MAAHIYETLLFHFAYFLCFSDQLSSLCSCRQHKHRVIQEHGRITFMTAFIQSGVVLKAKSRNS